MPRSPLTVRLSDGGHTWLEKTSATLRRMLDSNVSTSEVLRAALVVAVRHEKEVIDTVIQNRAQP